MMLNTEAWLVMLLEPKLVLARLTNEPGQVLSLAGKQYHSLYEGAVASFYDRILDDAGRLAGVRFWPTTERPEQLLVRLPQQKYLRILVNEGYFDVYFHGPPYPNVSSEGDQAFGGRVYEAAPGQFAVALDLGYLVTSQDDVDAVSQAPVGWVTAS